MPTPRFEKPEAWQKTPLCYPALLYPPTTNDQQPTTILEIGPGRGDFLFHLAETNPSAVIIGIELKSRRYFKLIDRIQKRNLSNIRVIQADARYAIANNFEPESINEIHINFPDPWPKRRHIKNRLINEKFIENCSRVLVKDGIISFVTDVKSYADDVEHVAAKPALLNSGRASSAATLADNIFPTYFAQKWQKEGREFYWMKWKKVQ